MVNEQSPNEGLITDLVLDWTLKKPGRVEERLLEMAHQLWDFRNPYFSPRLPEGYAEGYKSYTVDDIQNLGKQQKTLGPFVDRFTRWDEPHSRITESERQQPGRPGSTSAAVSLTQNDVECSKVVELFNEVFDQNLSVYDLREGEVGFVLGTAPENLSQSTQGLSEETKRFMRESPKLWYQGSGLRNVFGLLARIVSDDRAIVIMDEPEAFLHPHQAWKLGFVLARVCLEEAKQLICATHDRQFLDGLAQGAQEQLKICRLDYHLINGDSHYTAHQVSSSFWSNMRDKSRVRYSHVLECLFSNHVILVEAEKDALFYQEALDHFARVNSDASGLQHELMFLPTSGNSEFAPMAKLVKEMGPRVLLIGDLDLICNEKRFNETISAVAGETAPRLRELQKQIEKVYEQDPALGETEQDSLLSQIRTSLTTENISESVRDLWLTHLDHLDAKRNANKKNELQRRIARDANLRSKNQTVLNLIRELLDELTEIGIFLVPWGELEDFDVELRKNGKKEWVHNALSKGVHKGSRAQEFIARIVSSIQLFDKDSQNTNRTATD